MFASCPHCHSVVLVCGEVGTVFPDPHDLTAPSGDPGTCPSCGRSVAEYDNATSDQLAALRFTPDQYR